MLIHDLSPEEAKRKERERIMVQEGIDLWKKQKRENQQRLITEKQEVYLIF